MLFKKIVVPLDGSELAEQALQHAVRLARASNGKVVLVQAVEHTPVFVPDPTGEAFLWPENSAENMLAMAQEYLADVVGSKAFSDVQLRARAEPGEPAGVVLEVAEDERADLIIMSTHGRSGVGRWLLGSIAERVLRQAQCPVLVVRRPEPFSRMLVTLDGSTLSEAVLGPALGLARQLALPISLLRVEDRQTTPNWRDMELLSHVEPGLGELVAHEKFREASAYVEQMVHKCRTVADVHVQGISEDGQPAERILAISEATGCDVIAMSTHGRTGVSRWVYGSVTEKVLRATQCAMLIVRPPLE